MLMLRTYIHTCRVYSLSILCTHWLVGYTYNSRYITYVYCMHRTYAILSIFHPVRYRLLVPAARRPAYFQNTLVQSPPKVFSISRRVHDPLRLAASLKSQSHVKVVQHTLVHETLDIMTYHSRNLPAKSLQRTHSNVIQIASAYSLFGSTSPAPGFVFCLVP